ncbi:hypothetical protein RCL1_002703 [Eukaryota sp. TZLM3-RCL]
MDIRITFHEEKLHRIRENQAKDCLVDGFYSKLLKLGDENKARKAQALFYRYNFYSTRPKFVAYDLAGNVVGVLILGWPGILTHSQPNLFQKIWLKIRLIMMFGFTEMQYLYRIKSIIGAYVDEQTQSKIPVIEHLSVRESAIGKGVGNALIKTCIDYLKSREATALALIVYESNRAKKLYERLGFKTKDVYCHEELEKHRGPDYRCFSYMELKLSE